MLFTLGYMNCFDAKIQQKRKRTKQNIIKFINNPHFLLYGNDFLIVAYKILTFQWTTKNGVNG